MLPNDVAPVRFASVRTPVDPLVGFVFLLEEGALRGEVARVVRVSATPGGAICELETTGGAAVLPRATVAVICHRTLGHYYPDPEPSHG